jgi:hypothetical protein
MSITTTRRVDVSLAAIETEVDGSSKNDSASVIQTGI